MRRMLFLILALAALSLPARAAEVPQDLEDALPETAGDLLRQVDASGPSGFSAGIAAIVEWMGQEMGGILRQRVRGAALVLLAVVLCGAVDGFYQGVDGGKVTVFLPMAGALSVTLVTAGSLDFLMGLGTRTIEELSVFSKVLLPTLAAATAASGAVTSATVQQISTVFLADLLINLIHSLLVPLVYLYVGALAASAMLPENRLGALAEALKKVITWILTSVLLAFTVYLSVVRGAEGGQGRHQRRDSGGGEHPVGGLRDRFGGGRDAEEHHRCLWDAGDSGGLRPPLFAAVRPVPAVQAHGLPGGHGGRAQPVQAH